MSAFPARPLRRVLLSTLATVAGVVLLLTLKPHTTASAGDVAAGSAAPAPAPSATSGTSGSSNGPSSGSSNGSSSGSSNGPSNGSSSKGTSGTRTVDGDTAQTRYGPVQLRLTLTGGKITAVKAVQLPNDNPRDGEISGFAIPQLTQETLAAQSAKIDTVSGATYTSEGYVRSLQSALDKAGV
ncbi:FMN-binding protein [Streptomyces sp. NPDC003300]|uniref:FMN-binding protein n=1 Tax=unclassified Streptomyces TaxID=2593676 RepID=UPI0033B92FC1